MYADVWMVTQEMELSVIMSMNVQTTPSTVLPMMSLMDSGYVHIIYL